MSDSIYKLKMGQDNWNDIKFNQYDKGGYLTFKLLDAEGQAFNIEEGDLVTAEWNMTNNQAIIQTKVDGIIQTVGSNLIQVLKDKRITRKSGRGYLSIAVTNSNNTKRTSTFKNVYKVFTGPISEIVEANDDDLALVEVLNNKIVEATYKTEEMQDAYDKLDGKITSGRNTYEKLEQDINTADRLNDELKDTCNRSETDKTQLESLTSIGNDLITNLKTEETSANTVKDNLTAIITTGNNTISNIKSKMTELNTLKDDTVTTINDTKDTAINDINSAINNNDVILKSSIEVGSNGVYKNISGQDVQTITKSGFYEGTNVTHAPTEYGFYFIVMYHSTSYISILAKSYDNNTLLLSTCKNGIWSDWNDLNFNSVGTVLETTSNTKAPSELGTWNVIGKTDNTYDGNTTTTYKWVRTA